MINSEVATFSFSMISFGSCLYSDLIRGQIVGDFKTAGNEQFIISTPTLNSI